MMKWPTRTTRSPIGLDLGAHTMKAAQLTGTAGGRRLAAAVAVERVEPGTEHTAADLARMFDVLDRRGFAGVEVVVSVPPAALMTGILELPARAPGVPIDQLAGAEFARINKQDLSAVTLSTWDLPAPARASKSTHMMAVGGLSTVVERHLNLIEGAGFRVAAIDDPASAAARALAAGASPTALTVVVDWGWSSVNVAVLMYGAILYVRRLTEAGIDTLRSAGVKRLGGNGDLFDVAIGHPRLGSSTDEDGLGEVDDVVSSHLSAVCRDVGQAIGYVSHQYPQATGTAVVLTGGGSCINNVAGRVSGLLGVPATVARPAIATAAGVTVEPAVLAAVNSAVGLALFEGD